MNILQAQTKRAINSAINDKVIPEIQSIMCLFSSGQRDTESATSTNNQKNSEEANDFKTKLTKKDSRSAFDTRDTWDLNPNNKLLKFTFIRNFYVKTTSLLCLIFIQTA